MERQTWISPFGQEDILDEHDASDLVQVENSLQDDWQLDTYFGAVPKWLLSHGLVVGGVDHCSVARCFCPGSLPFRHT